MTPISLATNKAGKAINVAAEATNPVFSAIAVTPDGRTVYALGQGAGVMTPISTAANQVGKEIKVGNAPNDIVFAP